MTQQDLFINGNWLAGEAEEFKVVDHATNKITWQGAAASAAQVDAAVVAAVAAQPSWQALGLDKRFEYLQNLQQVFEQHRDELSLAISQETGKPLWETKTEVGAMVNKIDISYKAFAARCPSSETAMPDAVAKVNYKPHGVVGVIGPFNFPGHLPNGHIVPALLAGNTVVFKPSDKTPNVGKLLMQYLQQAKIPAGVVNLVQGKVATAAALAKNKQLHGLFFTGSAHTGLILQQEYAEDLGKILALEMGGNNPLIVWQPKDLPAAAYTILQSAYITAGQRCTCARRLIIKDDATSDKLLEELQRWIKAVKVDFYTADPEAFIGPVISLEAAQAVLDAQQQLQQLGATTIIPVTQAKPNTPLLQPGLLDVTAIKNLPDQEIFGPLLQVIKVKDFDAAIATANNTEYGLSAGLIADDPNLYAQFWQQINAGIVNWNRPLTGASSTAPFGGVGKSGNHRPSAFNAADYCAYPVASLEATEISLPEKLTPGIKL